MHFVLRSVVVGHIRLPVLSFFVTSETIRREPAALCGALADLRFHICVRGAQDPFFTTCRKNSDTYSFFQILKAVKFLTRSFTIGTIMNIYRPVSRPLVSTPVSDIKRRMLNTHDSPLTTNMNQVR